MYIVHISAMCTQTVSCINIFNMDGNMGWFSCLSRFFFNGVYFQIYYCDWYDGA